MSAALRWSLIIAALGIGVSLVYHSISVSGGSPLWLNLDDGYIHAEIAHQLAETGKLGLNPGEGGGGSSSALWTFLIANSAKFGFSPEVIAWNLSLSGWGLACFAFTLLAFRLFNDAEAILITICFAISGQQSALAVSGMESTTFLAMVILTLWALESEKFWLMLLFSSLAVLLRTEGILLAGSIFTAWFFSSEKPFQDRKTLFVLPVTFIALAVGLMWLFTVSSTFPSTLAGRRWLIGVPNSPLTDIGLTIGFIIRFVGMIWERLSSYIGPGFGLGSLWAGMITLLAMVGGVFSIRFRNTLGVIGIYLLLHLLFYSLNLPNDGHMGRYLIPLWGLIPLLVVEGFMILKERFDFSNSSKVFIGIAIFLLVAYIPQLIRWEGWNRAAKNHLAQVHLTMATELNERRFDQNSQVAAFDIGILSYFTLAHIIDLGGLTDTAILDALYNQRLSRVLEEKQVKFVIVPELEGSQRLIFFRRLGLSMMDFREVKRYSIGEGSHSHLKPTKVAFPALGMYK
ncbi:hypothetical protein K8I28_06430, partial [bacterium]|nr:hypothetical protein [bacterium]